MMTTLEGSYLVLAVVRQLFDYAEAQKSRAERVRAEKLEERVRELERKIAESPKP